MRKLAELLSEDHNNLPIPEKKKLLRKILLEERKQLAMSAKPEEWGPQQFLKALEFLKLTKDELNHNKYRVACYFPIHNELNLIGDVHEHWLFPALGEAQHLLWFEFGDGKTGYTKKKFDLFEKDKSQCFRYTTDMPPLICFIPGIAASWDGYRLGYGGGYYDRFLASMGQQVTSIFCLPSPNFIFDVLPFDELDQKVNTVIA